MRPEQIRQHLATGEMGHEDATKAFIKFHKDSTSSEAPREQGEGNYTEEKPLVVWGGSGSVESVGPVEDVSRPRIQGEVQFRQSNEGQSPRNLEVRFRGERERPQAIQARERQIASEELTSSDRGHERESSKAVRVWGGVRRVGSFMKDGFVEMSRFAAEHPKKYIIAFAGTATVVSVPMFILAGNGFWPVVGDAATTFAVSGTSALISWPALAKFHNWRESRKRERVSDSRSRTFGLEVRVGQPFTT